MMGGWNLPPGHPTGHYTTYIVLVCGECGDEWEVKADVDEMVNAWDYDPTCPTCGAEGEVKES